MIHAASWHENHTHRIHTETLFDLPQPLLKLCFYTIHAKRSPNLTSVNQRRCRLTCASPVHQSWFMIHAASWHKTYTHTRASSTAILPGKVLCYCNLNTVIYQKFKLHSIVLNWTKIKLCWELEHSTARTGTKRLRNNGIKHLLEVHVKFKQQTRTLTIAKPGSPSLQSRDSVDWRFRQVTVLPDRVTPTIIVLCREFLVS